MRKFVIYIIFAFNLLVVFSMALGVLATRISPEHEIYVILPYFGLAFAYLYVLQLLLFIFWLCVRRWWFALFAGVCLGALFTYFNNEIPITAKPDKAENKPTLTILTYNVNIFGAERHFEEIFSEIDSVNADIVCLQEFGFYKRGKLNATAVLDKFMERYPYRHLWYKNEFASLKYGVVTFSKHPIIRKEKVQYKSENNVSIFSDIVISGDTIRVFNNHLESHRLKENDIRNLEHASDESLWEASGHVASKMGRSYPIRARQADEIAYAVNHSPYPTICVGDFNDIPTSYVYHKIRGNQQDLFVSTHRGYDYTWQRNRLFRFRIDHILASDKLLPISMHILHSSYSDHNALVGTLALPQNN